MSQQPTSQYLDDEVLTHARAADEAVRELCRSTIHTPGMTPAAVAATAAHLAEMVAALPQAFAHLGSVIEKAQTDQVLELDAMAEESDVSLTVDLVRFHLEQARELAVNLYGPLDRAHQAAAHIISNGPTGETA